MLRLSVLDQTPVAEEGTAAGAVGASVELAQALDVLGFTRLWVAEHHHSPGFAGSAPEILAAVLLGRTRHLRIGTGGVLLPRYDPVKVAEVFKVLAAVYPGRIDLGLGRAGGPAQRFPEQVAQVLAYLGGAGGDAHEAVMPSGVVPPQVWLLGAGTRSAQLAGALGTSFAFAHFLAPAPGGAAFAAYRQALAAGPVADGGGQGVLAVRAVTADTAAKATQLADAMLLWRARKDLGEDRPLPSAATVRAHRWSSRERERAAVHRPSVLHGTPEQVHAAISELAAAHGVREVVVNTLTHDPADRLRSYQLLAEAFALRPPATVADAARVVTAGAA
ncbi:MULTISPECIES: MsnO8 family LLM class oxidoreductase [Streptomycetaceae]|nr:MULTISPECIES: MsnO8 family LLM class oxidoreductase [Streptomycetaceae]MYS62565.1 MsnO8 family LLM class oxidoreductase [Streptomyces sp. SID5468]CCB78497.1 conserved protein of unknown function [Streptantibioticus cattleyicolor NRRL 8057 = DSM 46488]